MLTRFSPGERVTVWAPNYPEWVILEFACAMAGVVLVTANPAFRQSEVQYVLQQSRSAGVITATEFRGNTMLAAVRESQPNCPELREIIRFDEWADFMASAESFKAELPDPQPHDPVMIQYTSGTTGFPKGALLHHRGLVNNGAHTGHRMGQIEGGVSIAVMPLFHTGGCVCTVLAAVSTASTMVLLEAFDPSLALDMFTEYGGTAMLGVPTMLVAMMEHPKFADADLSTVRAICSGGSLVPAPMVRRLEETLGAPFTIVFGQTECSPVASMTQPHDTIDDKAGTIGPPMPRRRGEDRRPGHRCDACRSEHVGEYCTRGYSRDARATSRTRRRRRETIDADGWLHTGDLCAMDARGYCTVEGRLKDMIIRGGENIYPRELEDLLFNHPDVGRGGRGRSARREVG